jgi:4-diphosphocytidyl-2-C-methyl-D-erythritol kinase
VIIFPNCKINLGLQIIRKRSDGYHDLQTVFFPIKIYDALEVIQKPGESVKKIEGKLGSGTVGEWLQFKCTGLDVGSDPVTNLCVKAFHLLKKDFPQIPSSQMHLHKTIPVGAGLGGGSADGAFTLQLINQEFGLGISREMLLDYALQLGSDCPFFIINKPCYATGRGEFLEPLALDLSSYQFIIVHPGIHINTSQVFSEITPTGTTKSIKEIIKQPIETWRNELKNDFEEPVFKNYPEVKKIKNELYQSGSIYAAMSGSGSAVYGIFEKEHTEFPEFPSSYFVREL